MSLLHVRIPVLRVDQGTKLDLSEFLLSVAEHGAVGRIRTLKASVPIRDGDANGGVLKNFAEPILTLVQQFLGSPALGNILLYRDVELLATHGEGADAGRGVKRIAVFFTAVELSGPDA